MEINKQTIMQFGKDLKKAVAELEQKYGVIITPQGAKYEDVEFNFTLHVANTNAKEVKLQRTFNNYPWFRDWYGKEFVDRKHSLTIIGYEPGKKYEVVCRRDDGQIYNYMYRVVLQKLEDSRE